MAIFAKFSYLVYLTPPRRGFSLQFCNCAGAQKKQNDTTPDRQKCDDITTGLGTEPALARQTDRRTDGQTDGRICHNNIALRMLTRDKNSLNIHLHENRVTGRWRIYGRMERSIVCPVRKEFIL